jgi:hypothetical protein
MLKDDQINIIRGKCIEANPEILALKFGCEVIGPKGEIYTSTSFPDPDGAIFADNLKDETATLLSASEYDTILGRPIRLADVLLALEKASDERHSIRAEKDGWFFAIAQNVIGMYNLQTDDLREQSEETIKFLYELLQ